MKKARLNLRCITFLASCAIALSASAADSDLTYSGGWRGSDDVVTGWDWSLPSGVKPATGSGIFNLNSRVPAGFPGNHLKQVNARWKELEPVEGKYDFSSIFAALNDRNYDGVMLNIRGMVVSIVDANGNPTLSSEITAPTWLSQSAPKVTEPLRNGVRITNMQIYDPRVKTKLLQLIKAIGSSGIPGDERLVAQIIHGVSGSRGEECCASQNNVTAVYATMQEVIAAWSTAYGPHAKKLAWLKEDPANLFDAAVTKGGMGARGGIIENWIRGQYTPGAANQTGQIYDNGYLIVDESFAPIAQGRTWLDEYEAFDRKFTSPERLQQNYRMATLRALQMRRSVVWTETDSVINPALLSWASLELGKTVNTAPDAWVTLISTWTRSSGDKEVKNFERWLYQRDGNGVSTTPTLRLDHSFNASGNDQLILHELVSRLTDKEIGELLAIIPVLSFGQECIERPEQPGSFFSQVTADLDLSMREWWTPDERFLSMLKRQELERVAIESGASITLGRLSEYKKRDLVSKLAAYFARTAKNAEQLDEYDRKGTVWVPRIMETISVEAHELTAE